MSTPISEQLRLWAWSVGLFIATVFLHTRHNDFPWYYHPDEPGKVEQVLGMRGWNFHHPMLLLTTTKVAVQVAGASAEQTVVEIGRAVSAVFTALSVVLLSLLAYRWRGWPVALSAGVALLLHHQLYELAHYMKEDTALLLGMALTFLAAYSYEQKRSLGAALALGVGCGLAISGKYMGVMALAIAGPVLLRYRREGGITAAVVALVTVVLVVNFPLLRDWETFSSSFARETKLVVEGQGQLKQSVPHARYWSVFLANATPVMWLLLLLMLWAAVRRRREFSMVEWMMIAFPFVYAFALSFSPKENDRYFLPATALFTVLAAGGAVELSRFVSTRASRSGVEIGVGILLALAQLPSWTDDRGGLLRYHEAFQRDDTAELVQWLRQNVPPPAVIAKDEKVRLPDLLRHGKGPGAEPLPNVVLSEDFVADLGSLEALREKGVTHLVITPSTYRRFERAGFRPTGEAADNFYRRKMFYALLKRDYEPVKVWTRGTVLYLHPGLEVYRIAPAE